VSESSGEEFDEDENFEEEGEKETADEYEEW
jgi:hypothetical protein